MTIKVGDSLPAGTVQEFIEVEGNGCTVGPNTFKVEDLVKGKKIAIFGLPGAFTPTCSAKHVPGYVANLDALKAKGVDEIWCISVNDAFVMGAWGARPEGRRQGAHAWPTAAPPTRRRSGLEIDLTARGMGMRCQRFSMLVDDGVVKPLNVEAPGKFEVSDADTMLGPARLRKWGTVPSKPSPLSASALAARQQDEEQHDEDAQHEEGDLPPRLRALARRPRPSAR